MSIESVMSSNHLILCGPLLLLPSIFPSIRVFSSELALHIRWPQYWSFSFSISPSKEYSGLISFRLTGFLSLLSKGLFKSLSQPYSLKASILQHWYWVNGKLYILGCVTLVSTGFHAVMLDVFSFQALCWLRLSYTQ